MANILLLRGNAHCWCFGFHRTSFLRRGDHCQDIFTILLYKLQCFFKLFMPKGLFTPSPKIGS